MYSVPTSTQLYDIYPKDFAHPSYSDQFNGGFNTGSGDPFYPQQDFSGMLPTFQNPNGMTYYQAPEGRQASAFQPNGYTIHSTGNCQISEGTGACFPISTSPPSGNTLSSSFLSSPSSSSEATLTPLPGPSLENIPQLYSEPLEDNSPQVTAILHARRRRTRGPNKRPSGTGMKRTKRSRNPVTGFPDLLVRFITCLVSETSPDFERKSTLTYPLQAKIPKGVRVALEANYCGDKLPLEMARRRRRKLNPVMIMEAM